MVKLKFFLLAALIIPGWGRSQDSLRLSLDEACLRAKQHYPVTRKTDLVSRSSVLTINNLSRGYLPQLSFASQATYQSEVTRVEVPLPGVDIPSQHKDQYKVTADVNQLLFDGGLIRKQIEWEQLSSGVARQQVEVELYELKQRISDIFFGILYLEDQLKSATLAREDITVGLKKVEAQVQHGTAFRSSLSLLKAELLKADQRIIEIKAARKAMLETLGLFLGEDLGEAITLEMPGDSAPAVQEAQVTRPELNLFQQQARLLERQSQIIKARNLPRASLFFQGGYGRPGLNLLNRDPAFYYIGGVRLQWSLAGYYTMKNERQAVRLNQQLIDVQRESFLLNTNMELRKQQADIDKLDQLLASDQEIIELRVSVKEAALAQLDNAVITASDYLREVIAEDQSRQVMSAHKLLLQQAKTKYQLILGN